jgi:signal transduction histidine kinase
MDDQRSVRRAPTEGAAVVESSAELSWPLVERRHRREGPPDGVERRHGEIPAPPTEPRQVPLEAPTLTPFRWVAFALAGIQASGPLRDGDPAYWLAMALLLAYTVAVTLRPIPYRGTTRVRVLVVCELALDLAIILPTGGWTSPFAYTMIPTTLLAGFVGGLRFSVMLTAAALGALLLEAVDRSDLDDRSGVGAVWSILLMVVAVTAGLSRRAFEANARTRAMALDRMSRLAEANALLFSLQRIAQTLPASLDLDDVLDSSLTRVRSLIPADVVTVLLYDESDGLYEAVRGRGSHERRAFSAPQLPRPLRRAMTTNRAILVSDLASEGPGLAGEAVAGCYAGLRARGALVGLIAVETRTPGSIEAQHAEVLTGLTEAFGIAIDNARLFRRIRSVGADEERTRIARDLHDRIGSSLALLGYEVDGLISRCERGEQPHEQLVELRRHITAAVGDVREMLYDLRTEVSESEDIVTVLTSFLQRVEQRSPLDVELVVDQSGRLPVPLERELWHIAREAITNAERHSGTPQLRVRWWSDGTSATLSVSDEGRGFDRSAGRPDSYGLLGMRERAASIGAQLSIDSRPGHGTTVTCTLSPNGGWT